MAKRKQSKPAPEKGRNPIGRPPAPILKEDPVADAITKLRGNLSAVARKFRVGRSAVQEFVGKHEHLKQLLVDARETRVDNAEDKLGSAVNKGEGWAICFTLKTLGRSRGYVEKHEFDHNHNHNMPDLSKVPTHELDRVIAVLAPLFGGRGLPPLPVVLPGAGAAPDPARVEPVLPPAPLPS